ncbi:MAG: hypothetical protein ACE5H0_14090 [Bacteroidota bacterium]
MSFLLQHRFFRKGDQRSAVHEKSKRFIERLVRKSLVQITDNDRFGLSLVLLEFLKILSEGFLHRKK